MKEEEMLCFNTGCGSNVAGPCGGWYLISDGFFGWEIVGPHLRVLVLKLVVQTPKLCVPSVHVPLIIFYPDINLLGTRKRKAMQASL